MRSVESIRDISLSAGPVKSPLTRNNQSSLINIARSVLGNQAKSTRSSYASLEASASALKLPEDKKISTCSVDEDGKMILTSNLVGHPSVKCAHLARLMKRLVDPNGYDSQFLQTFLMTHKLYVKSNALLGHVILIAHESLSESAVNTPVLLRAANLLKSWIDTYWSDFSEDTELLQELKLFLEKFKDQKIFQMLINIMKRKLEPANSKEIGDGAILNCPKPILPKSRMPSISTGDLMSSISNSMRPNLNAVAPGITLKLSECDPLEVARQLTLIEYDLFASIKVYRF